MRNILTDQQCPVPFLFLVLYSTHILIHSIQLRGACPPHKKKDFDLLVKQLGGDETKIQMKIQEWWEEPQKPQEEAWEDVNKKTIPTKPKHSGGGGGGKFRGERDRDRDRGGRGGRSDRDGGRGGRDGRGRGGRGGRGDRKLPQKQEHKEQPAVAAATAAAQRDESNKKDPTADQPPTQRVGVPKPVTNAPVLKGAWGKPPAQPATPATRASPEKPAAQAQQPVPVSAAPLPPKKEPVVPVAPAVDVGVVTNNDPTPAGLSSSGEKPAAPGGNVWATKGSAHLIRAEKPKPPAPAPIVSTPAAPPAPVTSDLPEPVVEDAPTTAAVAESVSTLETGLPPAVMASPPSTNAWGKDSAPAVKDIPSSPEAVAMVPPIPSVVEEVVAAPKPPAPKPPRPAPTNVLNMGHWETGDADDSTNLDFGFGSFGTEEAAPASAPSASATAAAANASPARPPPGLSIGGMPPMPANAVLVHELEHSLEKTNLNAAKADQQASVPQDKPITNPLPPQPNAQSQGVPAGAAPVLPGQPNYNQQYGMGMYNYNAAAAAGSGFVGVHAPAGPFLGGVGVVPQQQQPPKAGGISPQPGATPGGPPGHSLPPGGLYGQHAGVPAPGATPDAGNASADGGASNTANAGAPGGPGMPPGMPGMPPYNPALYYGQQQFLHGQHQQGMGYNYGYGAQFGGVQGGFGYQQQVMGQTGGYGAPHYGDDQHQQGPHQGNTHGHGGSGGYQKNNGGGYRGRNNHHSNNQYQNQYNPQQHGGYGQQPYGMGYQHDQYNQQRGGYGHNMGDPYGMQQQQQPQQGGGAGFQDDNDHNNKGRRGGNNNRGNNNGSNNNNSSLPQFQGGPMSGGQQQPFGLQGQSNDSAQTGTAGGAGGWANNNNQAGGWSGGAGASGWQQGS